MRGQLRVREVDFRDVDAQYDKVVSIGVLEHAGRDQLADVIKAHADFLKPGGLGLLHFIGHVGRRDTELFIRKHVFPGGWIPSLADAIVEMERFGLEVLDVENLRRHYAPTLDAWTPGRLGAAFRRRLARHRPQARSGASAAPRVTAKLARDRTTGGFPGCPRPGRRRESTTLRLRPPRARRGNAHCPSE